MSRNVGDKNFNSYTGYQHFNNDEPTTRIGNTPWYLKYEDGIPAFFLRSENIFSRIPAKSFQLTAEAGRSFNLANINWRDQVRDYFGITIEEICLIEEEQKKKNKLMLLLDQTLNGLDETKD